MQQINLLNEDHIPRVEPLVASHILFVWAGFIVFLLGLTGWHALDLQGLEGEMRENQTRVAALRKIAAATPKKSPEAVAERIASLTVQLQEIERLVGALGDQPAKNFSQVLEALSQAEAEGLWLTEIRIDQVAGHFVALKGMARSPDAVALYLQALSGQEGMAGQKFGKFNLSADSTIEGANGDVSFSIDAAAAQPKYYVEARR